MYQHYYLYGIQNISIKEVWVWPIFDNLKFNSRATLAVFQKEKTII